jgi:hypothetical protein
MTYVWRFRNAMKTWHQESQWSRLGLYWVLLKCSCLGWMEDYSIMTCKMATIFLKPHSTGFFLVGPQSISAPQNNIHATCTAIVPTCMSNKTDMHLDTYCCELQTFTVFHRYVTFCLFSHRWQNCNVLFVQIYWNRIVSFPIPVASLSPSIHPTMETYRPFTATLATSQRFFTIGHNSVMAHSRQKIIPNLQL